MGTKQQTTEFGRVSGIWFIYRIMQLTQWVFFQFRHYLSIYPVQHADDFLGFELAERAPGLVRDGRELPDRRRRGQLDPLAVARRVADFAGARPAT